MIDGLPANPEQWRGAAYSCLAGVSFLLIGFTLLQALRVGDLSLVGPLSSLEGLFFALLAIAKGEDLTFLVWVGVGLAVTGSMLAAIQGRARSVAGAGWAVLSSALWMLTLVLFKQAEALPWLSQAAYSNAASLVLLLPIAVVVLRRLVCTVVAVSLLSMA